MKRASSFLSLIALVCMITASPAASAPVPDRPVVRVNQGELVGRSREGVTAWLNIPYAAPPVGALRWRAPRAAEGWSGPRDAGAMGALCIQPPANGDPGVGPMPMSEDCLNLNIWRPEGAGSAPLPVMVWIHGGGFNNGSGTAALYDGAALARRGVVVVTLNYRLGRLGFFDHPALAAERAEDEPGGNYGLMDIIAALGWVRANIAAFGGDPEAVTVFGESAGGAAVTRLMIAPPARSLFHRAVVQSGLGRERSTRLEQPGDRGEPSAQVRGEAFVAGLGMAETVTADALRAVPADAFLTPAPSFFGGDLTLIDGQVVAQQVIDAFATGRQAPVPLIIGTNSKEFWWIKPNDPGAYGGVDDTLDDAERAALIDAYGGAPGFEADIISDMIFNEPARALARLHAAAGHPTYLYRFDVVSAAMPEPHGGATHASERPYVFDNLTASSWATDDMDQRAATAMADYWTAFARAGDPNGGDHPIWPRVGTGATHLLEFTNAGPIEKPVPNADRLDLIESHFRRLDPR
ncbi:carboxylesterase family protein [Brevundimonas sp.]|uniref:carboxylesterase/lipase family protein n=1 Tax=Brevundimonas sp. TaxID=1871086 RepID=UPI0025C1658D|nr:carboxylesterase family protein [Brevundimonas sp.]